MSEVDHDIGEDDDDNDDETPFFHDNVIFQKQAQNVTFSSKEM
jgi:hypothetical protein